MTASEQLPVLGGSVQNMVLALGGLAVSEQGLETVWHVICTDGTAHVALTKANVPCIDGAPAYTRKQEL